MRIVYLSHKEGFSIPVTYGNPVLNQQIKI